jgi:hypothetical protein
MKINALGQKRGKVLMGWKIYSWIIGLIFALGCIGDFISQKFDLLCGIDDLITAVTILGLICYAYKKRIINQLFWKAVFFVSILWQITDVLWLEQSIHYVRFELGPSIFDILFPVPIYIAIYLYSFRFFASSSESGKNL